MHASLYSEIARASVDQRLEHLHSRQFAARTALSDASTPRPGWRARILRGRPLG